MRSFIKITVILLWIQLLCTHNAWSQVGREFWFVAPEVSSSHQEWPVVLRITALNQPATVTISQPANSSFEPIELIIPANTLKSVKSDTLNFTLDYLENRPANSVLDKGLLITSTADITAYYEVACNNNPDKFALKGENALGTEFYIPSQTDFLNHSLSNQPKEHVDIVATEDNSVVHITPKTAIEGHAANVEYTVTLNRGQTYSLEAVGTDISTTLAGTYITSNKDIAITISDDSIDGKSPSSNHYDLIGDQLIPTSLIGNEYIAVRTNTLADAPQKVYILAVEDNTYVTINGDPNTMEKLNKGQQKSFDIVNEAIYIKADKPVYAYELTGLTEEVGSAILPSIKCTGSSSVSFTRNYANAFWVQILTQGKNRNFFTLTGPSGSGTYNIKSVTWVPVPGTSTDPNEQWYSAVCDMNTLSTGVAYTIANSNGLFHLSLLDAYGETSAASVSYGYFSSYSRLNVSGVTQECLGNKVALTATNDMKTYNWYSSLTGNTVIGTTPSIEVNKTGKYWVNAEVKFGGCTQSDTLDVTFSFPDFSLAKDTLICPEASITLTGPTGNYSYLWSDGSTTINSKPVTVLPSQKKIMTLTITDSKGCSKSDDLVVEGRQAAVVNIGLNPISTCVGNPVTLTNATYLSKYEWTIDNNPTVVGTQYQYTTSLQGTHTYNLKGKTADGCQATEHRQVTINPLPVVAISDLAECKKATSTPFVGPAGMTTYKWTDLSTSQQLSTSQSLTLTKDGSYRLEVTDSKGCSNQDDFTYSWFMVGDVIPGDNFSVCPNMSFTLEAQSTGLSNFQWSFENPVNGAITPLNNNLSYYNIPNTSSANEGNYIVSALDNRGCTLTEKVPLTVKSVPTLDLGADRTVCQGDTVKLAVGTGYDSYLWSTTTNPSYSTSYSVNITQSGNYSLTATIASGCIVNDDVKVTVRNSPTLSLANTMLACPNSTFTLSPTIFNSDNGINNAQFLWNNGATTETTTANQPGTYTLTLTDNVGCKISKSVTVSNYTLLGATMSDQEICDNTTTTLSSPLAMALLNSYRWEYTDLNGVVTNGPSNIAWSGVSGPGIYSYIYVDKNSCRDTADMRLTLTESPSFTIGDKEMCVGDTIVVQPDLTFVKYQWNNNPAENKNYKVVTDSEVGTHIMRLDVWNDKNCVGTNFANITTHSLPNVNLGNDPWVCTGDSAVITSPYANSIWNTGATTQSIRMPKGTYWVLITDNNQCSNRDTISVQWYALPKVDLGPDTVVCPLASTMLDAGPGFVSYLWHNGSTSQSVIGNFVDTVNVVRVRDSNGCYGWDTKVIYNPIPPVYELTGDTLVCSNDTLMLDADPEQKYATYLWNMNSDDLTAQINPVNQAGDYWVDVSDGCFLLRDTISINVVPAPVIAQLDTITYSQVTVLASGGTEPYLYSINNGFTQSRNIFNEVYNGTHYFIVEDANGCEAKDTLTLSTVIDVDVPNFFTPNNDGVNDKWNIDGLDRFPNANIRIYDRYGKLLIILKPEDDGWDGRYLNTAVRSDDYWYVVELLPTNQLIKGHFTLKR
jgi:gliding motility-associated-like protein